MKITLFALLLVFNHLCAQTITTFASMVDPANSAFDSHGFLYVSSAVDNRIMRVDSVGTVTVFAGTGTAGYSGDGGQATAALLNLPEGMFVDSTDNLYFSDAYNNVVRKVVISTGVISTVAGTGASGFSGDGGPATAATFNNLECICTDGMGGFYVSDFFNYRLRRVDAAGVVSTAAGNGTLGECADGIPATAGAVNPSGICVDSVGNLYISNYSFTGYGCKIRKVDLSGTITTFAGDSADCGYNGDDIAATAAHMGVFDLKYFNGSVFMADFCNNRIRQITPDGIIHNIAGNGTMGETGDGGPADSAEFHDAKFLSLDKCGNVYISDIGSYHIRKVALNPGCWPLGAPQQPVAVNTVSISPNPATTHLTITTPTPVQTLTLSNYLGQAVLRRAGSGGDVDVSGLLAGVYVVEVVTEDGHREFGKFVKE